MARAQKIPSRMRPSDGAGKSSNMISTCAECQLRMLFLTHKPMNFSFLVCACTQDSRQKASTFVEISTIYKTSALFPYIAYNVGNEATELVLWMQDRLTRLLLHAFEQEMCGYDGPIYATHPTKAIMPILLEVGTFIKRWRVMFLFVCGDNTDSIRGRHAV